MHKPFTVFWCNKTRVFGSYPTKEAARQAVEDKIRDNPELSLHDFVLNGPKGKE